MAPGDKTHYFMGRLLLTTLMCALIPILASAKLGGAPYLVLHFFPIFHTERIKKNLTSVADKYIIVCSSVFCTV